MHKLTKRDIMHLKRMGWTMLLFVAAMLTLVAMTGQPTETSNETEAPRGVEEPNRAIMQTLPTPQTTPVNEPARNDAGDLL